MGYTQIGSILGPAVGPILGGVISQYANWHYLYWLLAILSIVVFLPLLIFLPETCCHIVGDGSIPAPLLNQSLFQLFRCRQQSRAEEAKEKMEDPDTGTESSSSSDEEIQKEAPLPAKNEAPRPCRRSFNPLSALIIMFEMEGQLVNWNFRRHAQSFGYPVKRNRQLSLAGLPVEKARLEIAWPLILAAAASLILYGWIMHIKTDMAGPTVFLFLFGYTNVAAYKTTGILLVDIHPGRAATVNAASNLIKSAFGAASSAAIGILIDTIGIGWTLTILALIWVALSPCFILLMTYGPKWRKERAEKELRRTERKNTPFEEKQRMKSSSLPGA